MRTLIVGSEYGLGKDVLERFECDIDHKVVPTSFDVKDDRAIRAELSHYSFPFHALVYCAGINRINPFDQALETDFWESMDVNCYGFVRLIRIIRDMHLAATGMRCCFVTSNAANVPMRHSLSYNCSKAAANMAVKQMAREIHPDEQVIFAVAPNKLEGTPMSRMIEGKVQEMRGWSAEEAHQYQVDALPARRETDCKALSQFIFETVTGPYSPYIHGNILPFGGPV